MHFPVDAVDIGHVGRFFFWELLILFEQWAGHRLLSEQVARPQVRPNRPIFIPSVPVSAWVLKFGMVVSFLVAWCVPLPSCLEVLIGFCVVGLVLICPDEGILGGISVLMV